MARDTTSVKTIARNKKALYRFEVLGKLECGLELRGTEVKSLRAGQASIQEAYGMFRRNELWLVGATIPEYSHGNINNHAPARERRLLAHRRELFQWEKKVKERGITVVPLHLYFRGHLIKIEMALVRGKKLFDKRETEKRRSAERDMDRALSRRR